MLIISNLIGNNEDALGTASGVEIGETIMMHAPIGSAMYTALTSGSNAVGVETSSGLEVFAVRHIEGTLGLTDTKVEFAEFYDKFKGTPMLIHNVNTGSINQASTKTQNNLLNITVDSDYELISGEYVNIAGVCTDRNNNVYVLVITAATLPFKYISIFKCVPGAAVNETATLLWTSKSYGANVFYSEPVYIESHGIGYIAFGGYTNTNTDFLYDIKKNKMHTRHSLNKQTPYRYNVSNYIYDATGKSYIKNRCEKSHIYEINNVFVTEMVSDNIDFSETDLRKLYTSSNGLDWSVISNDHYQITDPASSSHGWFQSDSKIHGFFKDTENNRLCCICSPNKAVNKFIIYYTENGVTWKEGITLRSDRTFMTWPNDNPNPSIQPGDDTLFTIELCGEVVYESGYWYLGWASSGFGTTSANPVLTRFSNYTLTGPSGLENAMAIMEHRLALVTWGGPPFIQSRCSVALGFMLQNSEWVALWSPDPAKHVLGYWYWNGSDSIAWSSYDGYVNIPKKVMKKSDIPAFFNAIIASPSSPNFAGIPDYEIRTVAMAKCFNSANTSLTNITLDQAIHNTMRVKGYGKDFMYTVGTVEGVLALNFSNFNYYGSDGTRCKLASISGYTADWNNVLPITRIY